MNLKLTILILILSAFVLAGCNYSNQSAPTYNATPTPEQSLNNLNGELDATIDDGGSADLNQLQLDAKGL